MGSLDPIDADSDREGCSRREQSHDGDHPGEPRRTVCWVLVHSVRVSGSGVGYADLTILTKLACALARARAVRWRRRRFATCFCLPAAGRRGPVASARVVGSWIESSEWWPASRGRSWAFRLPSQDIVAVLSVLATKRDDTFSLLECERVEAEGEWRSLYREVPIEALSLDGPWQYSIRSRALAPVIPGPEPRTGVGWPAEFSMNGLVLLHHPDPVSRQNRAAEAASRIGIMHRIGNKRTGEVREHTDTDAFFTTLKRALRSGGATPT